MFCIYILYSNKTGTLYVGQTNNLEKRLEDHDLRRVFSTKNKLPVSLIHQEAFLIRKEAMAREKFFKSLSGSKSKRKILEKFLADGSSKS